MKVFTLVIAILPTEPEPSWVIIRLSTSRTLVGIGNRLGYQQLNRHEYLYSLSRYNLIGHYFGAGYGLAALRPYLCPVST